MPEQELDHDGESPAKTVPLVDNHHKQTFDMSAPKGRDAGTGPASATDSKDGGIPGGPLTVAVQGFEGPTISASEHEGDTRNMGIVSANRRTTSNVSRKSLQTLLWAPKMRIQRLFHFIRVDCLMDIFRKEGLEKGIRRVGYW